jgi:single-strand DNA-binding protein
MDLQRFEAIGRLTDTPKLKTVTGDKTVCNFDIACDGFKAGETNYYQVAVWGNTAKACGEHLVKGQQVFITGSVQSEAWIDKKDGSVMSAIKVNADEVQFLAKPLPKEN